MENLLIINQNGQLVVSSREVSENFGKAHKNVIQSVETLISQLGGAEKSANLFIESEYQDEQNKQTYKEYLLTRDGFSLLVMGFTGVKSLSWKIKYIQAFNEMETQLTKPMSTEDLIMLQAQSVKELKAKVFSIGDKQDKLSERVNNLDCSNLTGTPRQQLNSIIKKYALDHGITYGVAYNEFYSKFNTAYHTNLKLIVYHYKAKNHIKNITIPDYMEREGQILDGLRVASKMISGVN